LNNQTPNYNNQATIIKPFLVYWLLGIGYYLMFEICLPAAGRVIDNLKFYIAILRFDFWININITGGLL
jgi:hypothetical protein